ncbi:MAG TPA: lytic transglycosylase domain-containing protein [Thermoanaerobaculia bacterium]|nr:lytic transglycosylase domain-containing protein [Thermoanaerobaculia bacterium]
MNRFRIILMFAGATLLAVPGSSEVRLVIRSDGSKVIYNVPQKRPPARGSDLSWLAKQRDRVSEYDEIILRHCERFGVDPILAKAVIQVESNFSPKVVSHKGASGLMQLMPATARRFGVTSIFDPEENIRGGVEYLSVLQRMFPNNLSHVLAAYNAGEGAVSRYRGIPPYAETQTYVVRALTVYHGRPHGGVVMFGGGRDRKLSGGFKAERGSGSLEPVTLAARRRGTNSTHPIAR